MSVETKLLQYNLSIDDLVETEFTLLQLILATVKGEITHSWAVSIIEKIGEDNLPRERTITASYQPAAGGYGENTVALSCGKEPGVMVIKMMREERQRIQVLKKQRKHRDVLLPQKIKPRNRFVGVLHDSLQQPLCQQYDSIGFFTVTDFFIRNTEPVESTIQYFLQTYRAIEPTNHLLPKQVRNR